MKNLTSEMMEKAKGAKSVEEILDIAKANGVEMTEDEAKSYYAQLNSKVGELNDDDLEKVSAGGSMVDKMPQICPICKGYFMVREGCPSCGKTTDEIIEYCLNNSIKTDFDKTDSDTNSQTLRSLARGQ